MTRTILVCGAASGLGAAFVDAYSKRETHIIAVDRQHHGSTAASHDSRVRKLTVDISSEISIQNMVSELRGQPVDLVIHSAGIRGLVPEIEAVNPSDVGACESLEVMDSATMIRAFSINTLGTFLLLRALLPNLRLASASGGDPKVIVISSRMGSISSNDVSGKSNTAAGSAYAYRASKAGVNAIVRSFAVDIPEVTFVLCHPGRVETNLVTVKEAGAISAAECIAGLLPLIEQWNQSDNGRFYDRFGEVIPW